MHKTHFVACSTHAFTLLGEKIKIFIQIAHHRKQHSFSISLKYYFFVIVAFHVIIVIIIFPLFSISAFAWIILNLFLCNATHNALLIAIHSLLILLVMYIIFMGISSRSRFYSALLVNCSSFSSCSSCGLQIFCSSIFLSSCETNRRTQFFSFQR